MILFSYIHFLKNVGDERAKEQPELTIMHSIWMKQHNKLAGELADINPSWNDETLYQEARKIVGAQMQHITYKEWLPIIIGRSIKLKLKSSLATYPTSIITPNHWLVTQRMNMR